jgi:hypothetical protein
LIVSLQETYEKKKQEHVAEMQKKEEEMRQMFVVRVKEKESELKEAEKEVISMNLTLTDYVSAAELILFHVLSCLLLPYTNFTYYATIENKLLHAHGDCRGVKI